MTALAIIGSNGQLGWELVRQCRQRGIACHALDFPEIDIADAASIRSCLNSLSFLAMVNAAAYTAVDRAESEAGRAFAVNCDGAAHLAEFCRKRAAALIHVSTDYVFDGAKNGAYGEQDAVNPLGVYGRSKAAGEEQIRNRLQPHVILRTAWLYGIHGHNFVKTMLKMGRECKTLRVVADQHGCPTFAADLADAVLTIAAGHLAGQPIRWGTYHYCGRGATTWHGFANAIFELAGKHDAFVLEDLVAIGTADYATAARRPANSVLDCSKIERQFSIRPRPWKQSLAEMIEGFYQNEAGRLKA